jgi:hypothetical protein
MQYGKSSDKKAEIFFKIQRAGHYLSETPNNAYWRFDRDKTWEGRYKTWCSTYSLSNHTEISDSGVCIQT